VSAGIKAGFAGHGSHRPGSVCFECERENAMTPDSEAGPVKDWYDRDAEAFGRAHRQSQAQPVPSGLASERDDKWFNKGYWLGRKDMLAEIEKRSAQPVPSGLDGLRQWLYEAANDDEMPVAIRAWLQEEGIDTILRLAALQDPA
jgi:hypothetical protein